MADHVTVPAVGPVSKKALLIGGGAGGLLIAFLWWRKRSTPLTPDTSTSDPSLDGTGSGMAGGGGALAGVDTGTATNTNPATNAAWTQLAMNALAGVTDPAALSLALGLYLTGSAVTTDQEHLIDQAIAVAGYPPVAGPTGYPPGIRTQPATGQTPTPTPTPAPSPSPSPTPTPTAVSHVVVHGDTLGSIARSWGTTAGAVYNRNAADIEYQAHIHGHASSNHGDLIFPGERLYKP